MLRHGKMLVAIGSMLLHGMTSAEPVPVELRQSDAGWQLFRNGEPYFIKGAGGEHSLEALKAAGANSVRTWGGDASEVLDAAHALGMTVTVGIWLEHERHGFDYDDPRQVAEQLERARATVEQYKDHPALLLWGVGNETEGFDEADDPAVWKAINDVAAMIKEVDPHHPTMAVTVFVHGQRIDYLHRKSPAVDIHGINAYGGAQVIPKLFRDKGATKPFVLTEFGPVGPWEMPQAPWGVPFEQTSAEKADFYRESYEKAIVAAPGIALGAYAFLWGHKMEATETWFGMFLADGSRTAAVDAMTEVWGGQPPSNRAPTIEAPRIGQGTEVAPNAVVTAQTSASDPDDDELTISWVLRPEPDEFETGGDFQKTPPAVEGAIIESDAATARVRMPEKAGAYRLFVFARDSAGNAATANLPLLVTAEPGND